MFFSELGLTSELLASLDSSGYTTPTPLQLQLIPLVKERKNVIVWSQTAAGKTGAFLIPLVDYLLSNPLEEYQGARILVLTSRRDRVNQINFTLKKMATNHEIRSGFISSGRPYQHQMRLLRRPLDFLIATPGRLDDLVNNDKADFSNLEMLVVDDLSSIYYKESQQLLEKILAQTENNCPSIVFARENDEETLEYARSLWPDSVSVEVEEEKHPLLKVPQIVHLADDHTHKIALMDQMLDDRAKSTTLIVTATPNSMVSLKESLVNHGHNVILADDLPDMVEPTSYPIVLCHDKTKTAIASDQYEHIILFDLPNNLKGYEERIVGKGWEYREKEIVLLIGPRDRNMLKKIERFIGDSLEQRMVPGLEPLNPYISTPTLSLGGIGKEINSKKHKKANNKSTDKRVSKKKASNTLPHNKQSTGRYNNDKGRDKNNRKQQRKGAYGRLNGGIHRKRNSDSEGNIISVDNVGNSANSNYNHCGTKKSYSNQKDRRSRYFKERANSNLNPQNNFPSSGYNPSLARNKNDEYIQERSPTKARVVIRYKKDRKHRQAPEDNIS